MNKINLLLLIVLAGIGVAVYFVYSPVEIFPNLKDVEKFDLYVNEDKIEDNDIIEKIRDSVVLIRKISDTDESARYGIDEKSPVIKFVIDNREYIIRTGNINPHNSGVYVLLQNKIYLFSKSLKDILNIYIIGGKR
jgi:hypothetical protein